MKVLEPVEETIAEDPDHLHQRRVRPDGTRVDMSGKDLLVFYRLHADEQPELVEFDDLR